MNKRDMSESEWQRQFEEEQRADMSWLAGYKDKLVYWDDLLAELSERYLIWDALHALKTYCNIDITDIGLGCVMELLVEGGWSARTAKNAIRLHIGGERGKQITSAIRVYKGRWSIQG